MTTFRGGERGQHRVREVGRTSSRLTVPLALGVSVLGAHRVEVVVAVADRDVVERRGAVAAGRLHDRVQRERDRAVARRELVELARRAAVRGVLHR
jgi:hypothetical protein